MRRRDPAEMASSGAGPLRVGWHDGRNVALEPPASEVSRYTGKSFADVPFELGSAIVFKGSHT
jgi:hypothetical protein